MQIYLIQKINNMKHKHKAAYLKLKQLWWEKLPQREKDATTKPGSIKTR